MTPDQIAALEQRLSAMTDAEVARALNYAELESEEADVIAGEAEKRNLDF